MKQTVEEAEKEYCEKNYPYSDLNIKLMVENAFEAGAEWQAKQSHWISVKEKDGCDSSNDCIVMDTDGEVFRAYFSHENKWLKYGYGRYDEVIEDVTHWMPIPSFDETLKANKDDFLSHHIDKVKMEIIRIVANDAQAMTFQTLGQYRSWLMKTINELSYPIPEL